MARQLFAYTVRYRQDAPGHTLRMLIVAAEDADDARAQAGNLDPLFGNTIETPRRGRAIEACRFCHLWQPILDGTYTRVQFPDGIALVCDECAVRAEDVDVTRYATWQDT